MRKPTKEQYFAIKDGIICANCLNTLKHINQKSSLCVDCWLLFTADGSSDIQCEQDTLLGTFED